jgi:uncharacterized protein (TIGR00725 family)
VTGPGRSPDAGPDTGPDAGPDTGPDAGPDTGRPRGHVAVVGPSRVDDPRLLATAEEVGRRLAGAGAVVLTGGGPGVMAAASRGAVEAGGLTVGLLPGTDRAEADPAVLVAVPTGLGEMRNVLLVRAADAVVCVGGSWGTLSEVALAVRTGVPVCAVHGWDLPQDGPVPLPDAAAAAAWALVHLPD